MNGLLVDDQPPVDALPEHRVCGNCGCAARMNRKGDFLDLATASAESFVVCRRNMPQASEARSRQPRVDAARNPVKNGQGAQVFDEVVGIQIGYPATLPEATCYDGWRPAGTLPGVRWEMQRMAGAFVPVIEKALAASGVSTKQARQLAEAMLTGLIPARA